MSPSSHSSDPVEGFIEQSVADMFGPSRASSSPSSSQASTPGQSSGRDGQGRGWFPVTVIPVAALVIGLWASAIGDRVHQVFSAAAISGLPVRIIDAVLRWCAGYTVLIVAAVLVAVVVDVMRWYARRHRMALTAQVYASTFSQPRSVWVGWPPGWRAPRRAVVRMSVGSVITDKRYDALVAAITSAANNYRGADWPVAVSLRERRGWTAWVMKVDWQAGSGRVVVTRSRAVDTAATHGLQRRRLDAVLTEKFPLPDARVTSVEFDDAGVECGFTIEFSPTIHAARPSVQQALREALIAFLPAYEVADGEPKRVWTLAVHPERETMVIGLAASIPTYIPHLPLKSYEALSRKERFRIVYATGAAGVLAFWDIGQSTDKPHMLVVGPTGAGKTVLLRTIITEAVLRGVPVLAVDPKMIELNGMEGYPGVAAVVYNLRQIVALINAVHAEMMARNLYIQRTHLPESRLLPFIFAMDEFFVMSGFIRRALKYKGEDPELLELKIFVSDSDPLGKVAEILALVRKVGGRVVTGVQRPDAKNFGEDAGSVRDNYGTRASSSNLYRDGAMMMWNDENIGRDLDTSVPGRATVTGPDGTPITAQVHWTPDVDMHPNKWEGRDDDDRDRDLSIVTALRDATGDGPEQQWHSAEMRQFLETYNQTRPAAPTPIAGVDPATAGDDGIWAKDLSTGDRVIDDNDGRVLTVTEVIKHGEPDHITAVEVKMVDPKLPRSKITGDYEPYEIVLTADPVLV